MTLDEDLSIYYDKVIEGALALGFVEIESAIYKCTRDQLLLLCATIAQSTERQVRAEYVDQPGKN